MSDALWARIIAWLAKHNGLLVVPSKGTPFVASAPRYLVRGRNWIPDWPGPGRFVESHVLESCNQGTPHD